MVLISVGFCGLDLNLKPFSKALACSVQSCSFELVIDALCGHQHLQRVTAAADHFHHLIVASVLHIYSIDLHQYIVVFYTCPVSCSVLHHLQKTPSE